MLDATLSVYRFSKSGEVSCGDIDDNGYHTLPDARTLTHSGYLPAFYLIYDMILN